MYINDRLDPIVSRNLTNNTSSQKGDQLGSGFAANKDFTLSFIPGTLNQSQDAQPQPSADHQTSQGPQGSAANPFGTMNSGLKSRSKARLE